MSFIEEHCIVFDNEDENKLEYTTLHKVVNLLVNFVGILKDCGGFDWRANGRVRNYAGTVFRCMRKSFCQ